MPTMMLERTLTCNGCGTDFAFSVEEQEFFMSKGFQDPKKCQPCRQAARSQRNTGYSGGGYQPRMERELFDVTCAACGQHTQIPFRPKQGRPVYCRACYTQAG